MTTPPFAGERAFGPYCGCRYAGRRNRPDEAEVWLLYERPPFPGGDADNGPPIVGVLYNRPNALTDPERTDRWLARPYGPAHKGTEVEGMTEVAAARNLWLQLNGQNPAALAAAETRADGFNCGGDCDDPP